jgi:hypothetical protein
VHHKDWENVTLPKEKIDELRKHNFKLGYTKYEKSSEYR